MPTYAWIFYAVLLATCAGTAVYLLVQGPIPGHLGRSPSPWLLLFGRLCFMAVAAFAILVMQSVIVFALALGFFAASVVIEWNRRRGKSGG